MADFSIINQEHVEQHAGQKGYRESRFLAAFNSTDATSDLPLLHISQIDSVQVTAAAAPATDESFYVSETMPSSGPLARPSDRKLTIGRTGASPTSALKVFITVKGR